MALRRKTVKRLAIIAAVTAALGGTAELIFHQRQARRESWLAELRDRGVKAYQAGDYYVAADALDRYLSLHEGDDETILAYAVSKTRAAAGGNQNMQLAQARIEFALHAKPNDLEIKHALLQLCPASGDLQTMERVSDEILRDYPDDALALEARVTTRLRQSRFEDALVAARQRAAVRPNDLEARIAVLQLMMRQRKPSDEVSKYAADFEPGSQSAGNLLLRAIATDYAGHRDEALSLLRQAANSPVTDVATVGQIVNLFDAFKRVDEAATYLKAAVARGNSPDLHRALALRLWQQEKYDQFPIALPEPATSADSAVLALRTAALFELHDPTAKASLDVLNGRSERVAIAWADAIEARYVTEATPGEIAKQLGKALSRDPDNGVIRAWLGDCYATAGEWTLATRSWAAAASQLPNWSKPCVQDTAALLLQKRTSAAVQAAASGFDRSPSAATAINLVRARFAALNASGRDRDEEQDLAAFIERYHDDRGAALQMLPARVALLARGDRRADAQAAVDAALAKAVSLDADTALDLAGVLADEGLNGTERLFAVHLKMPTPQWQLARSTWLAQHDQTARAFDEMAAAADPQSPEWRLAHCQFLEAVASPKVMEAWRSLGDRFPGSAIVQSAVGNAAVDHRDAALAATSLERLHNLTDDVGQKWRMLRARMLMSDLAAGADGTTLGAGVEAVTILTDVVREVPNWITPRLLLANALARTGNAGSAIEHLRAASAIDPSSADTVLELVKVLRQQERGDEIPRALRAFIPPTRLGDSQRIAIAAAMAEAGQSENAVALLQGCRHPLPSPGQLLLAEQCRQLGNKEVAGKIYASLLGGSSPSPAVLASAAEFYAMQGDDDRARATLARMADSGASPVDVAIANGRYEERFGNDAEALRQLQIAAATKAENGQVALVDFYLRHNRAAEATGAAQAGLKRLPHSRILSDRLIEAEAASARGHKGGDLGPLIEALSHDPSRSAEVAALKSLNDLGQSQVPPATLAHKLRQIAAAFPGDLPLAQQTVLLCIRQGDSDGATVVAQQAMNALPNEPAAARLLVDALRAGRRWDQMLQATDAWRARLPGPTLDLAAAQAEALLGQEKTDAALDVLKPYRQSIAADARAQPQAATVLARALLSAGKPTEAIALIGPLFRDAAGRRTGRDLARSVARTLSDALACVDAVNAATPSTAWDEQNDQADLLADIGRKFDDQATLEKAMAKYRDYLKVAPTDNDATLDLAGLEQQLGDSAAAEKHLRGLLTADPGYVAAKNDLACLLLAREARLDEAERLARSAVAGAPTVAAYQDTLARILSATGRPAEARSAFQAALRLDPNLIPARLGLARLMRDQGDTTAARVELRRVDGTLRANPRAGVYVADELSALRAELTQLDQ